MAKLSDLKFRNQLFMRAYPYRHLAWTAARLKKPLSEACVAVVTTAGLHLPHQPPFDRSVRGGDVSWREIPAGTAVDTLLISHKSDEFDGSGIERDKNLVLPLDRLNELAHERHIGGPAPNHFSFMGSITAPGRLISTSAPEVVIKLTEDRVDAVLLTPV